MADPLLLINLGSPSAPTKTAVRAYLKEFLSDPYVIDLHPVLRWALLYGVILPFRTPKTLKAYQAVWQDEGSPLVSETKKLAQALESDRPVFWAMRYGSPSIKEVLSKITKEKYPRLTILPLYPQYAASSTGTALVEVFQYFKQHPHIPAIKVIPPFYREPEYLGALAQGIALPQDHHLVFSFHGLPERHIQKSESRPQPACREENPCPKGSFEAEPFCYRAQCYETARGVAQILGLRDYSVGFQSRLGRTPWIRPYTDLLLPELLKKGIKKVSIVCPSFVIDCLETLEEIGIRAREDWLAQGGEEFQLIPCLNASAPWVSALEQILRKEEGTP
jgi:ferrochelatase